MKKKFPYKTVLCISIITISTLLFAASPWKLVREKKGIKVYTREIKGYNLDEFKGVGYDKSRIEVIGIILEDIPNYPKWTKYLKESRFVKKFDDNNFIIYSLYDVIRPISDRECIARVKVIKDFKKGEVRVFFKAIDSPLVPKSKKIVRITNLDGEIFLKYVDRENTRGMFRIRMDFGGHIPNWLSNMISKRLPEEVLEGLRKEAHKEENIKRAKKSDYNKEIENAIKKGYLKR